jgi:hypothetical protein
MPLPVTSVPACVRVDLPSLRLSVPVPTTGLGDVRSFKRRLVDLLVSRYVAASLPADIDLRARVLVPAHVVVAAAAFANDDAPLAAALLGVTRLDAALKVEHAPDLAAFVARFADRPPRARAHSAR